MSHFIAHTISFSKDFQTFRVKGGDNNVVPRSNSWSGDIPIDKLYYNLNGGMIKLNGTSEKNAFIRHLVVDMDFGGDWVNETDYYHMKGKNDYETPVPEVQEFDRKFIAKLREGLKSLGANKKTFVLYFKNRDAYANRVNPTNIRLTWNKDNALKMGYYRALEVCERYGNRVEMV